ncbi:hypothetical protein [Streptacidiphilus jiangxiensis]|uniref:Ig-like domain (Group 3) n=1 Tax=Streptacidiphilus jiangxiensis TaxID=235985 RepID=A0A1H7JYY8_STRJI|nr:hypothetical protein [Streptacidiphilus jiangxiensis]SEK78967.1 hypothetical protein SAMN05414137_103494 [Streptacidiphilus jiangxiensis]
MRTVASRLSRMSRKTTLTAAAVAALSVGAAVVPAAANASTTASGPQPAVKITLGAPAPHGPLLPGGSAETFTITATNTTGKAQAFEPTLLGKAQGALGLIRSDVKLGVTAVHAPATALTLGPQDGGILGAIMPKGGKVFDSYFTLPAHASYTWKVSVAAGATWQANDNALRLSVDTLTPDQRITAGQTLTLKVGRTPTGGPVTVSFKGASTLALGRFENVDLTVTNHSGARLSLPIGEQLDFGAYTVKGKVYTLGSASADIQVLKNGHWVTLGKNQAIPTLTGLANGASHTFHLRVRLTGYDTVVGSTTKAYLDAMAWTPTRGPIANQSEILKIANS